MIEGVKGKGVNRAKVTCDECGKVETVSCGYIRTNRHSSEPDRGQVLRKVEASGWAEVKAKLFCPTCEAKRKVANKEASMSAKETTKTDTLRTATPKQKREIIGILELVYDDERKRFRDGESDKTVADAIGDGVLWGWVAQIREELFGPDSRGQEVDAIRKDVSKLQGEIDLIKADTRKAIESLESKLAGIRRQMDKVAA